MVVVMGLLRVGLDKFKGYTLVVWKEVKVGWS